MVLPAVTACGPAVVTTGSFSFSSSAQVLASRANTAVRASSLVIVRMASLLPASRSGSALDPREQGRVLGRLRPQDGPAAVTLSGGLQQEAARRRMIDIDEHPRG